MSASLISLPRVLSRFAQGLLGVVIAASIAFLLLHSVKGDVFTALLENSNASPEDIDIMRKNAGLTAPLFSQYMSWLGHVSRFDLLRSFSHAGKPVQSVIGNALPNTLLLMSLAFVTSLAGGIALGAWQGVNRGTRAERTTDRVTLGILSVPDFWVGMMLIALFAIHWQLLPVGGMSSDMTGQSYWAWLSDRIRHLVMPWFSLTLINGALFARFQRASMQDVVGQQFLRTARAKGVPESTIVRKHALRVAVLPLVTIAGMFLPALLVGTILIEKVFSWPGMGMVLTSAISARDYPLVSGIVIVGSGMTALGSFLADITREIVDPRLRS